VGKHGINDIGFSHGTAKEGDAVLLSDVLIHAAAGTVRYNRTFAGFQTMVKTQRQSVFFPDIAPRCVNDGQSVAVRVLTESDIGLALPDKLTDAEEILSQGFRGVFEGPIWSFAPRYYLATKGFEQG
jgi:hypothetical protein